MMSVLVTIILVPRQDVINKNTAKSAPKKRVLESHALARKFYAPEELPLGKVNPARTAGHYRRICEAVSGCLNCRVGW
jgi:hypothetical protein